MHQTLDLAHSLSMRDTTPPPERTQLSDTERIRQLDQVREQKRKEERLRYKPDITANLALTVSGFHLC